MAITSYQATNSAAAAYVSVGNTAVTFMSLANYSTANVLANVWAVPSAGTASNTNIILNSIELQSLDTYQLYVGNEKLLLENGDSIQVNASQNSAVTVVTSYTSI